MRVLLYGVILAQTLVLNAHVEKVFAVNVGPSPDPGLPVDPLVGAGVGAPAGAAPGSPAVGTPLPGGTFNLGDLSPFGNCGLECIAGRIANFLLFIGGPIAAIMVLVGGFQMITAGGSSERFAKGQKTLLYAAIGLVVLLVAKSVTTVIIAVFS